LTILKLARNANNAGIGNKLVTIFARHLDNFIMTINFSLICQFFSGSGQILHSGQLYTSPGLAKIAPWWLALRDSFSAKVQHDTSAGGTTNAYCPYQRAVNNNTRKNSHIRLPALQVIKCIMIRKLFTVYQFVPRRSAGTFIASFRVTNPATLTIFFASLISLPTRI